MKSSIFLTATMAGLAICTALAFGGTNYGSGVAGSKHDMNILLGAEVQNVKTDVQGRVCAFCHTPHHKVVADLLNYNPLWSHEVNTVGNFTAYQSMTFQSKDKVAEDVLVGPSRLCMSCHDGTIAGDQHYGIQGTATGRHLKGDRFGEVAIGLNNDLSNDHPIGFDISGITDRNPGIRAALQAPNNLNLQGKPLETLCYKGGDGRFYITCASCHEVHNRDNVDSAFLYEKQLGSSFCLMCHDK